MPIAFAIDSQLYICKQARFLVQFQEVFLLAGNCLKVSSCLLPMESLVQHVEYSTIQTFENQVITVLAVCLKVMCGKTNPNTKSSINHDQWKQIWNPKFNLQFTRKFLARTSTSGLTTLEKNSKKIFNLKVRILRPHLKVFFDAIN